MGIEEKLQPGRSRLTGAANEEELLLAQHRNRSVKTIVVEHDCPECGKNSVRPQLSAINGFGARGSGRCRVSAPRSLIRFVVQLAERAVATPGSAGVSNRAARIAGSWFSQW